MERTMDDLERGPDGRVVPYGQAHTPVDDRRIALVDLLDRVLAGGVVITGEVTLSIADVDLVHISLRTLISSVSALSAHTPGREPQRDVEVHGAVGVRGVEERRERRLGVGGAERYDAAGREAAPYDRPT
jgi:hypothetical protein